MSEIVAHQLADEVSVLRAEIERLRDALRRIIAEQYDHEDMLDIASAALRGDNLSDLYDEENPPQRGPF